MELRDNEVIESQKATEENEITPDSEESTPLSDAEAVDTEGLPEEPRRSRIERLRDDGFFRKYFVVIFWIFVCALAVYIISRIFPAFGELMARYPSQGIRFLLANLTNLIPFSLAECLIISIPLLAIAYVAFSSHYTKLDESRRNYFRWLHPLLSAIMVVATLFCLGFGPCYGRYTLARNLGIDRQNVSAQELFDTAKKVAILAQNELANVTFEFGGASVMPYGYDELVDKMNTAFGEYAETTDYIGHFYSNPKAIALSEAMTYTHISGVYAFMTGESNINTNYPDFLMPYTMAHEMSHQRGIAREDEANFTAFLVCIGSDDAYIRYSGYINILDYLIDALFAADKSLYMELCVNYVPNEITYEFSAFSLFFEKYRNSTASAITGSVNNAFLQLQGQSAGTKSYGLVVDLAVAYYKSTAN